MSRLASAPARIVTLAVAALAIASVGSAAAAGNSVSLKVPRVTAKVSYTITISGTAAGRKHLYLFVDSRRCGKNPAVEVGRTGPSGSSIGYYWRSVRGRFTESATFTTKRRIKDHACAYLANFSARKNSRHGVVAHAFRAYRVH